MRCKDCVQCFLNKIFLKFNSCFFVFCHKNAARLAGKWRSQISYSIYFHVIFFVFIKMQEMNHQLFRVGYNTFDKFVRE